MRRGIEFCWNTDAFPSRGTIVYRKRRDLAVRRVYILHVISGCAEPRKRVAEVCLAEADAQVRVKRYKLVIVA